MSERTATEIAQLLMRGMDEGLAMAAQALLEDARAEVPVAIDEELHGEQHPGQLRESGRIEVEYGGRVALVAFGGQDVPYAAKIHEALHYQHPHGGKARYLEDPLKAMVPRVEGIVAAPVRKLLKGS